MAGFDEREIFVAGPVVVFRWRNEAGWPVEYVSPNAAGVFGYSPAEFMRGDVSYGELIAPEDASRVAREVAAATESGAAAFVHEPYRVEHRAGGIRWLYDFTNIARDDAGRATHYLGYVIDITAHMQAEAEKRELERCFLQSQKLESLGLLAGGVAHDFNNLLAGILGQASLARRALGSGSTDLAAAVDQIETLTIRAAELTRQLLAYSGRGRFVVHAIDLGELVRDMTRMLEVVVSKQATLRLELAPELPAVEVDPTQIRQIVMNLITNASDALDARGGSISIRVTGCELDRDRLAQDFGTTELAAGRYVSLEVTDTGCGMDESVIAKLFDPFFTTKASGRGLGMSAVLGIVRGHEGAIRVRSQPGEGSSFEIVLPASDKPVPRAEPRRARVPWSGSGAVLVVDDEDAVRSTAAALVRQLGFSTREARHGAEALEIYRARTTEIVLVVLDVMMPVLGGPETLEALRALDPRLPVLLTSGFTAHDPIVATHGDPITGFLQKPYRIEDVESAIRALLARE